MAIRLLTPSPPLPFLSSPSSSRAYRSRFSAAGLFSVLALTLATSLLPSLLLAYTTPSKIEAGRSRSTKNEGDAAVRLRTNTTLPASESNEVCMRYNSRVKIWERPPS